MTEVESSPEVGLNSKMKRKKAEDIPLASLRNDSQSFQKFQSSSGVEVEPFHLRVPLEEDDFKLVQYMFSKSLPDGQELDKLIQRLLCFLHL